MAWRLKLHAWLCHALTGQPEAAGAGCWNADPTAAPENPRQQEDALVQHGECNKANMVSSMRLTQQAVCLVSATRPTWCHP